MHSIKKFLIFIVIIWFTGLMFTFPQIMSSTPKENRLLMIIVLILSILIPLIAIISQYKLNKSIFSTYPDHQKGPRSEIERIIAIIVALLFAPIVTLILIYAFLLKYKI